MTSSDRIEGLLRLNTSSGSSEQVLLLVSSGCVDGRRSVGMYELHWKVSAQTRQLQQSGKSSVCEPAKRSGSLFIREGCYLVMLKVEALTKRQYPTDWDESS